MGNLSYKSFNSIRHANPDPNREHELHVVLSTRFLKDEETHKVKWPGIVNVVGSGRSRMITVSEEYLETVTDWFDIYGCNWQE